MPRLTSLYLFALVILLAIGSLFLAHRVGKANGSAVVQAAWDKQDVVRQAEISRIELELARKESEHTIESKRISAALEKTNHDYQIALTELESVYTKRLLLSTQRASTYQRQANGTALERDTLAQHAAELDRTLEEGRRLVRELRDTLEQREVVIQELGKQILLDRNLLTESSGTNGSKSIAGK